MGTFNEHSASSLRIHSTHNAKIKGVMQRYTKRSVHKSRATLRPKPYTAQPQADSIRGRRGRIQKRPFVPRKDNRKLQESKTEDPSEDARDAQPPAAFPGLEGEARQLHRQTSIHACSEASLGFVKFAGVQTDEDTNTITLNLMDYFLFSEDNWLSELSYCKLHAACFLFASRITGKSNTVEQIADSLGPDSPFVQFISAPLAGDEDSAVAIQYAISVTASEVEDGYALLYERKERLAALMGAYAESLDNLPLLPSMSSGLEEEVREEESEDFDVFDDDG